MVAMNQPPPDEGSRRLAAMMQASQEVADMCDLELVDTVIDEVLDVVEGRNEALVLELLNRFKMIAGIERDDEGNVIETGEGL